MLLFYLNGMQTVCMRESCITLRETATQSPRLVVILLFSTVCMLQYATSKS